jgi:hypothetical protein
VSNPVTPMVALGVVSYANNWKNTGSITDVKPLLFAGIGAILLGAFGSIPGMEKTATLIGWTAFIGMFLGPVQKPSPIENLLSITGGKG